MELSNFLANVFGLSIIAVNLSLLLYPKNIKKMLDFAESGTTLLFTGLISFVIGTAMILSHNIWAYDWKVIITLLGWAILIKGIIRLFLPDMAISMLKKTLNSQWISPLLVAEVILGCVLLYFGFTA